MNSREIEQILQSEKNFIGCFAYDDLPDFPVMGSVKVIINTGSINTKGDHWIAMIMTSRECLYFDSFGLPILNQEIMKWLEDKYESLIYSNICIQHFSSNLCGAFCIAFLENVKNKRSFKKFINSFSHINILENDEKMKTYLKEKFQ